jgi:hypothetical protein
MEMALRDPMQKVRGAGGSSQQQRPNPESSVHSAASALSDFAFAILFASVSLW